MNVRVNRVLNNQVSLEFEASYFYLRLATLLDSAGYSGASEFFYRQSDEERVHMLKLIKYIIERGGEYKQPIISPTDAMCNTVDWKIGEGLLSDCINESLHKERQVTQHVNEIIDVCKSEHDYTTDNFIQWFVTEQLEEERTFSTLLDKINLIGSDKGGLYILDKELSTLNSVQNSVTL